jgi:hypothetical protein
MPAPAPARVPARPRVAARSRVPARARVPAGARVPVVQQPRQPARTRAQAIRRPTAWAMAQREFRLRYRRDPRSLRREPAIIRWWTNRQAASPQRFTAVASTAVGRLRTWRAGRGTHERTYVAVYAPTADVGAKPVVCFPVANGSFPVAAGSSDAVVVGEIGLHGVCCIELPDGSSVWPVYSPTVPVGRLPGAP